MDMAGGGGGHSMSMTPPECFAADGPFLTSVAWCLHSKCAAASGVPASKLESFWEQFVTGSAGKVPARWTYAEALAVVDPRPPPRQLGASDRELNATSIVNPVVYLMQWNVSGGLWWTSPRRSPSIGRYMYAVRGSPWQPQGGWLEDPDLKYDQLLTGSCDIHIVRS